MKTQVHNRSWKRIAFIVSIIVVIVAVLLYVYMSVQAWNTANADTLKASSNLKQTINTQFASETAPASTLSAVNEIIKKYNDTLQQGPCKLPAIYEWQSNLPWLKDNRQTCLDTTASSNALIVALTTMQTFKKQESAAALLIKQASDTTATSSDYTAAAAAWQKVADDPSLSTNEAFKPVGSKIVEVSKSIADAYSALVAANTKQDKTAFDSAKKALTDSYARLAEIKSAASEAQAGLVDTVIKAYQNV